MELTSAFTVDEITVLRTLPQIQQWNILVRGLEKYTDEQLSNLLSNPVVNDTEIKRDFRYRLGYIKGLRFLVNMQKEIEELINE